MAACERFGCLPSTLLAEPAEFLQLLAIEYLGRDEPEAED